MGSIDTPITMTSADFSRQALLHTFRKKGNYTVCPWAPG